jgi:hypothetical protein
MRSNDHPNRFSLFANEIGFRVTFDVRNRRLLRFLPSSPADCLNASVAILMVR